MFNMVKKTRLITLIIFVIIAVILLIRYDKKLDNKFNYKSLNLFKVNASTQLIDVSLTWDANLETDLMDYSVFVWDTTLAKPIPFKSKVESWSNGAIVEYFHIEDLSINNIVLVNGITETNFNWKNLAEGRTYKFGVAAYDNSRNVSGATTIMKTLLNAPPDFVTNINISQN